MRFGRSSVLARASNAELKLAWLAGLLEGEGTFLRPIPSAPGCPAIACQMVDADVVERVGGAFRTAVHEVCPKGARRPVYVARLRGARAVELMTELASMMSRRRQTAIRAAIGGYSPPIRKLNSASALEIRELRREGASVSFLARAFQVSRPTIRQVLEGSIHNPGPSPPHVAAWAAWEPEARPIQGLSSPELCWLAGWLEGEGSFLAPPPSDPRRVRISAVTCDSDVAAEAGRLLSVKPRLSHSPSEARLGKSPIWNLLRRGRHAVTLMASVYPLMGQRRQAQIDRALAAVDPAD